MPNPSTAAFASNGASGSIVNAHKTTMVIRVTFMAQSLSSFASPLNGAYLGGDPLSFGTTRLCPAIKDEARRIASNFGRQSY